MHKFLNMEKVISFPAVNAQARQAMFMVIASSAQTIQIDLAKN